MLIESATVEGSWSGVIARGVSNVGDSIGRSCSLDTLVLNSRFLLDPELEVGFTLFSATTY